MKQERISCFKICIVIIEIEVNLIALVPAVMQQNLGNSHSVWMIVFRVLCKYSVTLVLPISDFISTFVGWDTVFSREYK